jgi:hypothetical protein
MEQPIQHRGRSHGVVGTLQDSRADRKLGRGGTVLLGCLVTLGTYVAPSWSSGRKRTVSPMDGREGWTIVNDSYVEHDRAAQYLRSVVDRGGSVGTARAYAAQFSRT